MSLSHREKTGSRHRSRVLKPSEYLRKHGVELPPDTARYIDKYGTIYAGEIDIPGENKRTELHIRAKGFMHAGDGEPYIGSELRKEIHNFLFNGDPRYAVDLIQKNPEIAGEDGEEEVYEYVFTVYDNKIHKDILKVYAEVVVFPIKRGEEGEIVYGEAVIPHITLEPLM